MNSGFYTWKKKDTSNQNRERCFFTFEKNDASNHKPQRCVSFAPKFPPFLAACLALLRTHSRRKVFLKEFFLVKKVKNISEMEWNSFVCSTVDNENCGEPANRQGEVYKIKYCNCQATYIGETGRKLACDWLNTNAQREMVTSTITLLSTIYRQNIKLTGTLQHVLCILL